MNPITHREMGELKCACEEQFFYGRDIEKFGVLLAEDFQFLDLVNNECQNKEEFLVNIGTYFRFVKKDLKSSWDCVNLGLPGISYWRMKTVNEENLYFFDKQGKRVDLIKVTKITAHIIAQFVREEGKVRLLKWYQFYLFRKESSAPKMIEIIKRIYIKNGYKLSESLLQEAFPKMGVGEPESTWDIKN